MSRQQEAPAIPGKKKEVRVDITLAATFSIVAFPRAAARGTAAINHPFLCFHTYHPPPS